MIRYRILFAEDNKEVQAVCCRILKKAGYDVDIAENGRLAVEAMKASLYDLLLMDIQMPEMDGITATKEIRKLESGRKIPIIAFTALADDNHRRQCLAQGMDDCLFKPVTDEVLLKCLDKWLNRRPAILIADDMEDSRKLLEQYLRKTLYTVMFAKNGIEAISLFSKEKLIELILLDMEMPVMDGYTAARALASLMPEKQVPIIAMTAHEGERESAKCTKAGCTGFLSKPVTQEALMQVITEYIGNKTSYANDSLQKNLSGDYIVHIDPEIMELVPRYIENRRKDITEIRRLLAAGNIEAVRIIGHSMAGSGGGYGFPEIGKIGKDIETAALHAETQEIGKSVGQLAEYLSRVTVVAKKEQGKTT